MFNHVTVLLEETINELNIRPDGTYVDCTLGGGGHSAAILSRLTSGHLYGFDRDMAAITAANDRLSAISPNFTLIHSDFRRIRQELEQRGVMTIDGCVFDLGVSSPQFDDASRGFSYQKDARLDMRMDQTQSLSAYEVVNEYKYEDLVRILYRYGEEKFAKSIARRIEESRKEAPIETTLQLAEIVKSAIPARARRTGGHPAKRTFQAIRIEVNDELGAFDIALDDAMDLLSAGGRVCVITFHSLEDRICKRTFVEASKVPDLPKNIAVIPESAMPRFKRVTRKPITAGEDELQANNRAHSAKLRVIERIADNEKNPQ